MHNNRIAHSSSLFSFFLIVLVLLGASSLFAQQKKSAEQKLPITIVNNKTFEAFKSDTATIYKFSGDVQFQHGTDLLFCDTAYLNAEKNNLEAFGNVKIVQTNGTTALSDYLSYSGNIKKAYLSGNVSLTTGKDNLWTEELDYFLKTKIGNYYQGGTLQSGNTTVSSNLGTYNAEKKEARFVENVLVNDSAFNIESKDLSYNTESKMMRFFDSTVVIGKSYVLRTTVGMYDAKNQIAQFITRSSLLNEEQYIEGDTLLYNKVNGQGRAIGNVIILDTAQKAMLYCGKAFYNEKKKTLLAVEKPVLKRVQENDSLFVRADTFYSAHLAHTKAPHKEATRKLSKKEQKKYKKLLSELADTNPTEELADTTSPKYYAGFHHVRIFSDSLQGKCDSICFTGKDSLMLMMKNPVIWSRKSQISGDTIMAFIKDGKVNKIRIPNAALIVSRSGPEQAQLFNQVQGRTLIAYLVNEALDNAIIKPDAESIYYPTDESGAYIGVTQAQSERMKIFFKDGEINKLLLEQSIKETLNPLDKIDIPSMKLSRFKWLEDQRPKSIIALFE